MPIVRRLLIVLVALGLMLSPGASAAAAMHAAPMGDLDSRGAASADDETADAGMADMADMPDMADMHDCHGSTPKSQPGGCGCCDTKAKCTLHSCSCLKCFGAAIVVRPGAHAPVGISARHIPHDFDRPPDGAHRPSPPPPQS